MFSGGYVYISVWLTPSRCSSGHSATSASGTNIFSLWLSVLIYIYRTTWANTLNCWPPFILRTSHKWFLSSEAADQQNTVDSVLWRSWVFINPISSSLDRKAPHWRKQPPYCQLCQFKSVSRCVCDLFPTVCIFLKLPILPYYIVVKIMNSTICPKPQCAKNTIGGTLFYPMMPQALSSLQIQKLMLMH